MTKTTETKTEKRFIIVNKWDEETLLMADTTEGEAAVHAAHQNVHNVVDAPHRVVPVTITYEAP